MRTLAILGLAAWTTAQPLTALAAVGPDQAAQLGKTLTPLGAERAGNADGSIPAWDGGIAKGAFPHKTGGHYADPFASDKPLFTITRENLAQYASKLSEGQRRMFELNPGYKMNIYKTRRTASFPQEFYDASAANARKTKLSPGGNGVLNATDGIPFPIPSDGQEAIWNHLLRYRGSEIKVQWSDFSVLRNGGFTPAKYSLIFQNHYNNFQRKNRIPNRLFNFVQIFTVPSRLAGVVALIYEPVDQVKESRTGWTYTPGQRRVRLSPTVAYDNPPQSADGLRTFDDYQMFNGAIDRYNWKLLGKKEMYVPYNSYKLCGDSVRFKDIIRPGHVNQDHVRYELHRVWVVEANLKPDTRNIYKRRVFYLDEDSWTILLADKYDAGGALWRLSEQHVLNYFDVPMLFSPTSIHYDLTNGRYLVLSAPNEEKTPYETVSYPDSFFTPAGLRITGNR